MAIHSFMVLKNIFTIFKHRQENGWHYEVYFLLKETLFPRSHNGRQRLANGKLATPTGASRRKGCPQIFYN